MARAMSVIIPGRRFFSSRIAPCTNGQPPYANTGMPSTGTIHDAPGRCGGAYPKSRGSM
jgi:hypothetical protein